MPHLKSIHPYVVRGARLQGPVDEDDNFCGYVGYCAHECSRRRGGGGLGRGGIGEYPYSLKGSQYQGRGRSE